MMRGDQPVRRSSAIRARVDANKWPSRQRHVGVPGIQLIDSEAPHAGQPGISDRTARREQGR